MATDCLNGTKTILIVDDDEPTRVLLQALMRRSGLESVVAQNGAAGIEALASRKFDLVLLDLMMPAVDGRGVIAYLSDQKMQIPVTVCTAAGPKSLDGLNAGVVKAVMRKPFDIAELAETIESLVGD